MFIDIRKANKIVVTQHAKQRAYQRAKLFMFQHELANIHIFLQNDFLSSSVDMKFVVVPFYKNKLETKYGKGSFISHSKLFKYMAMCDNDRIVIRSVAYIGN